MITFDYPQLYCTSDKSGIHLEGRLITVGSSAGCKIKLPAYMPDIMAHLIFQNGSYNLQKLTGGNDVIVNGKALTETFTLKHKDSVSFRNREYIYLTGPEDSQNPPKTESAPVNDLIEIIIDLLKNRNKDVFTKLVTSVSRLLLCDAARLLQEEEGSNQPRTIASFPKGVSSGRFSNRAIDWARKSFKTILMKDTEWENSPDSMSSLKKNLIGSILCAPLFNKDELIGYLYMDRLRNNTPFSEDDRAFCDTLRPLFEEILITREEQQRQKQTIEKLQNANIEHGSKIIHESKVMQEMLVMAGRVACTDTPVFIFGETGTGKELVARYIHDCSNRKGKTFIAVNCGAIPENLIESEMFGHEKGSFTGAHQQKIGYFEYAQDGTLFLDEIGELPLNLQVKLLRVLQEGEITRVGGTKPIKINVRIISATNLDLTKEMGAGRFREDLYFRLNVINIKVPSLRERERDVLLIADYYLSKYSQQFGLDLKKLDSSASKALQAYHWPGNIRELENIMQKAVLLSDSGRISLSDINMEGAPFFKQSDGSDSFVTLKEIRARTEKDAICAMLKKWKGNVSQSAKQLDIDRTWLMKRMKEYGINPDEYRD